MTEITRINLENEMDLILAHKQSMKLAELAGLSLSAQTIFATAVSELLRSAISNGNDTILLLLVSDKKERQKFITALVQDKRANYAILKDDGYNYAKKLVPGITATSNDKGTTTEISYRLPNATRIDDVMVEKWQIQLNSDPAISPYEEIKRKNRQLVEMAEKLSASEQQYKTLTNSLPIIIFSLDNDNKIIYANDWLGEYTGKTIEELNEDGWSSVVHPEDLDDINTNFGGTAGRSKLAKTQARRLKLAGTEEHRWHTGMSIPIIDDKEQVQYRNVYMVDIHAQKMIEEALNDNKQLRELSSQLEEKLDLLDRSNQKLEQFAYIASHDLQEPLRKISFYCDVLNTKYAQAIPPEASVFFNNLITASQRMKILVQDILAYSTVRKDVFTQVDLNELAREILQDLEISINEKQAQVTMSNLPIVEASPGQLKQLFENIISNALKFSKPGEKPFITIEADVKDSKVFLSFTDNGIGFEEKYGNKIFDLFQRLHPRESYSGTGIGLAICKKIAEMHNGTITVKSQPGIGTSFLIVLPVTQAQK